MIHWLNVFPSPLSALLLREKHKVEPAFPVWTDDCSGTASLKVKKIIICKDLLSLKVSRKSLTLQKNMLIKLGALLQKDEHAENLN